MKEVSLLLENFKDDFYTLPQSMFSNSSLTELYLRGCFLNPRRSIKWRSLTKLIIKDVELHQHVIEKILSGCPFLYSLLLIECWGFNCLEVKSRILCELAVKDNEYRSEPLLEISAPYKRFLNIGQYPEDRQLQLTNIPSVVKACIDFTGEWDYSEEVFSNAKKVYEYLKHVKELELGCCYRQVLSRLVENGWQLPQSRLQRLMVDAGIEDASISGIVGLLESSPDLEALDIEGYHIGAIWYPPTRGDLECDLLKLKTVNISDFAEPRYGHDPMLTLAQILLKRSWKRW